MSAKTTEDRILAAALAEFAAHGFAGARVDRIAAAARRNKNLIYVYVGDKEALFANVMQRALLRIVEELPFEPDDLPAYAERAFDFAMRERQLMRLMAWYALEQGTSPPSAARRAPYDAKVSAVLRAQDRGLVSRRFSPRFLITAVMTLASAWSAAGTFGAILDADATRGPAALRAAVADAVRLLATARPLKPAKRETRQRPARAR